MISYTDLFGAQRAKMVPMAAIKSMQEEGAGFAGFATWLDMSPAQALLRRYEVIAEICDCMLALGWKPYQSDHEDATSWIFSASHKQMSFPGQRCAHTSGNITNVRVS